MFMLVMVSCFISLSLLLMVFKRCCLSPPRPISKLHMSCFLGACAVGYQLYSSLSTDPSLSSVFDPYEILELRDTSSMKLIRNQYRQLSKLYHPDKHLGQSKASRQAAADKFRLLAKAYETLTDPVARKNYKKYGHPDGRQAISVAIGLPTLSGPMVLLCYAVGMLGLIGLSVLLLGPSSSASGGGNTGKGCCPCKETLSRAQIACLANRINADATVFDLLIALAVVMALPTDTSMSESLTDVDIDVAIDKDTERHFSWILSGMNTVLSKGVKTQMATLQPRARIKMIALLYHLHQNHLTLPTDSNVAALLQTEIQEVLVASQEILKMMEAIATKAKWIVPLTEVIRLSACLVQGALKMDHVARTKQLDKLAGRILKPVLEANAFVDDEDNIQVSDLITLEFKLTRKKSKKKKSSEQEIHEGSYLSDQSVVLVSLDNDLLAVTQNVSMDKTYTVRFNAPHRPGTYPYQLQVLNRTYMDCETCLHLNLEVLPSE